MLSALRPKGPALFQYLFLYEDLGVRAKGERDRVAGPTVDVPGGVAAREVDPGEERVVLELVDDDPHDPRIELLQDVSEQVVRHGPGRRDFLHLDGDGVGFEDADPDRK